VAVIYGVVAELTLLPATSPGRVTPMWPAAGVAVAAMLLRGRGLIPGIAAGALITTSLHMSIPAALAIALGIMLEALIDVRLLQRFEFDERLERVRDPLILSAVSLAGAAVAGVLGMLAIVVNGTAAPEPLVAFVLWWMRDWLGVQIVVALVATWARSRRLDWTWPRLASRLVGGIAHDFNNLLTAILGYTEIVMVSLEPGDPRRADTEEIARSAMRAGDLTRQMLAFSRKQVLQPKVIDLNVTLSKVEPMLRRVIGEDIVMTIAAKATAGLVRVDAGQIEQVIMNLVVNARDAMPRGGRLTVETSDVRLDASALPPDTTPGMYALLAVSDTGVGMPADVRARIFEPYFTTKDIGKGTRLGLSTAYDIIRQSDGHIQVYSEPGLGTTFRIYLPRSEAAATVEAPVDENMPRGTEHILLVEDDPSVRRMSREILERLGYSITEAASGRAGLALGSDDTRHFDLAFCDVILGDISGPAVYEALRALRPSVRVLYMSGYVDEAIVRTGVLDEGHPCLQKPFTPRDLAVKLREVLDRKEDE